MAAHGFANRAERTPISPASGSLKSRETHRSARCPASRAWRNDREFQAAAAGGIARNGGLVRTTNAPLANSHSDQRGDCDQLSGSADAAGGDWRDTQGDSDIESDEGAARLRVSADVWPNVCRRRAFDGSARHAEWVSVHYDFLVAGVREPCVCGWSRYAGGE